MIEWFDSELRTKVKRARWSERHDEDVKFVRITWVDYVNCVRYRVVPIEHFRELELANFGLLDDDSSDDDSSDDDSSDSDSDDDDDDENGDGFGDELPFKHSGLDTDDDDDDDETGDGDGDELLNKHSELDMVEKDDDDTGQVYYDRVGITLVKATLGMVGITLADGFSATGEYLYCPEGKSARELSYAPGHVGMFGCFKEKQLDRESWRKNASFDDGLCPRMLLKNVVKKGRDSKLKFLVGFETEVIFLSSTHPITPVNDYGWSESPAICAGSPEANALDEIAEALNAANIELQMLHSEGAPGQYEIVTGPLSPVQACDALIVTREIIMNVAAKHGIRATLAPRIFSDNCGSAAHAHISVASSDKAWSARGKSVRVADPPSVALTSLQQHFLSGLLTHLPATLAFTLPTRASYTRMVDGAWSGGTWVSWGRDNRETPIRLAGRGPVKKAHFEIKCIDGTSNPYLAMAALLSAGLDGILSHSAPDPESGHIPPPAALPVGLTVPACSLSEEQRKEYGVEKRMPLNLDEARNALETDEVMKKALGEKFVKAYLSVNKTLDEQLKAPTPEEEMLKLIKRY